MMRLDHLAVIAPTLEEGVAHVYDCLGVDMPIGGKHPLMGTHNHLMRIGEDVFLEVIAVDPDAPGPDRARWFGFDDPDAVRADWDAGLRLKSWVVRTDDLEAILKVHGELLGQAIHLTRGNLAWDFAVRPDGALPMAGAVPCVMDWGPAGTPVGRMADLGVRLTCFVLEHPKAEHIQSLYSELGVETGPDVVPGPVVRYRAWFDAPSGQRELS